MRRNIKKILSVLGLALSGILILGGCSCESLENTIIVEAFDFDAKSIITAKEEEVLADTQEDEQEEEATPVNQAYIKADVIEGSAPSVKITTNNGEWFDSSGEVSLVRIRESKVEIISEENDVLKEAISTTYMGYNEEDIERLFNEAESFWEHVKDNEEFNSFAGYEMKMYIALERSDSSVISFRELSSDFMGGAHNIITVTGRTFDTESGSELELEDILVDTEDFYAKAIEYITDKLKEDYSDKGLWDNYEEAVSKSFEEERINWYLNAAGIVIVYNSYGVGPFSMGVPEITLPYVEFAEFIKEKYRAPHSELIAKVPKGVDISILLGEDNSIRLEIDDYTRKVTVVSGKYEEKLDDFAEFWDGTTYIIKNADGRSFIIISIYCLGIDTTTVYEVTGGELRKCDALERVSLNGELLSTDEVGCTAIINMLGTYGSDMTYTLSADGKLEQKEKIFGIDAGMYGAMTVTKELPVILEGKKATLPVGTVILVTGTDNIDTVYFRIVEGADNGKTGKISVESEYASLYINNISEYEYFDLIPYAG